MVGAGTSPFVERLQRGFESYSSKPCLLRGDRRTSYGELLEESARAARELENQSIAPGSVVALAVELEATTLAYLLALLERRAIAVLCSESSVAKAARATHAQFEVRSSGEIRRLKGSGEHKLYESLRAADHAGVVLSTSGSTGRPKTAVHDFERLTRKLRERRKDLTTVGFFRPDHIGGLDTLLYCLANSSTIAVATDRSPDAVCALIERHHVQVLPVSPTFLNLLILSEAWQRHDLSSLLYITYGAEVMPEATLARCHEVFPQVRLLQRYGSTEFGSLPSRSRDSDSLWLRLDEDSVATRVVNGELEIRSESAMLGYLEDMSPFTEDGWIRTGDSVDEEDGYLKIRGRRSDQINVGGEKVYPAEVENVVLQLDNVQEVLVFGEDNPVLGSIVAAEVRLDKPEPRDAFVQRLKRHCAEHLDPFKVPVRVSIEKAPLHGERFTKLRERKERV